MHFKALHDRFYERGGSLVGAFGSYERTSGGCAYQETV